MSSIFWGETQPSCFYVAVVFLANVINDQCLMYRTINRFYLNDFVFGNLVAKICIA